MKKIIPFSIILTMLVFTSFTVGTSFAGNGGYGGNGGNGGYASNGSNGGHGLSDGTPGCGGGTDPSPDGKFYLPGTNQECNPSDDDRKKLR